MGEDEATNVTAGIWGFLILFGLAVACWFLYRSMSKHLRNVRLQNDAREAAQEQKGGVHEDGAQNIPDDSAT